jgi:hypothetical protein
MDHRLRFRFAQLLQQLPIESLARLRAPEDFDGVAQFGIRPARRRP